MNLWMRQIGGVLRLEMKKTFLSRRGWWVYFLALGPVLLTLGHWLIELGRHSGRHWQRPGRDPAAIRRLHWRSHEIGSCSGRRPRLREQCSQPRNPSTTKVTKVHEGLSAGPS